MYRFIAIITLFFALSATAQDIAVKSFRCLPKDMDARIDHPVTDQNGDVAALIKVVTTEKGFKFEAGSLGVTAVEKKTGEYWVYVPYGSRKITIKHDELGVLRNYVYPEPINKATVYEMVLTTGRVVTTVEEVIIPTQYLIISSEPEGATVFINEQQVGTTPFQRKYEEGEYTYRVEYPKFHPAAGKVTLKDEKQQLNIKLKPNFGQIAVTSSPENGMKIYLDDENTGKTTPDTLINISSGNHIVQLRDKWYHSQGKKIKVQDDQVTDIAFEMRKAFGKLTISTNPDAVIYIDDEKKGDGTWSGRLLSGYYTVKVEKDRYYNEEKQVKIEAGEDQNLEIELKGKTGSLDVMSMPIAAEIYLDNEKYGTSPETIKDLLIGEYEMELRKPGYASFSKHITIKEDETLEINTTLDKGKEITINSVPGDAFVYIDDEMKGKTPLTTNLSFGEHNVEVVKGMDSVQQTIEIKPNGISSFDFSIQREISITSNPAGADIYINGKHQGQTPATLVLTNKNTTIKFTKNKYRDKTIELEKLPEDNQIAVQLDEIKLVSGYSMDVKVGNGKDVGFGSFGSFGIALFLDRVYLSSSFGLPAQPNPYGGDISHNCYGIMVNDIDGYTPVGRYYLGDNDYDFSAMKEYSNGVFSFQAGYQFAFPVPFAIHAGIGARKSKTYQHVYQAKHDYFSIDGYNYDISEGEYFTTPVAYSDGYTSLVFGIDIPLGFLKIGAEYWINTEVDNVFYLSAGLFFSDNMIKKMQR